MSFCWFCRALAHTTFYGQTRCLFALPHVVIGGWPCSVIVATSEHFLYCLFNNTDNKYWDTSLLVLLSSFCSLLLKDLFQLEIKTFVAATK